MTGQPYGIEERTAIAIYEADVFLARKPLTWAKLDSTVQEKYRRMARGALAVALAEPVPVPA